MNSEEIMEDSVLPDNKQVSDLELESEIEVQNKLKNASEKFQDSEIIAAKVLEFEYNKYISHTGTYSLQYNNKEYILEKHEDSDYVGGKDMVYVPVFILDYGGLEKTFACKFYTSKEGADKRIRFLENYYEGNTDNDSFRYHILSEDRIIQNLNRFTFLESAIVSDSKLFRVKDLFISGCVMLLSLLILNLIYVLITLRTLSRIHFIYPFVVTPVLLFIQSMFYNYINNTNEYKMLEGIDRSELIENNDLLTNERTFKSVNAEVSLSESGLKVYSEELDSEWFYERKSNSQITDAGVKLLNNLPVSDGYCVLTVVDDGYADSDWISSDEEWWIDLDSSL